MSTYVLYNSLSGNGTGKTKAEEIKPFLSGKELVFEDVTKITDANAFFAGLNPDDELYLCGGDGTLLEVMTAIEPGSDTELAHIPCGSGNDFVRNFHGKENFLSIEALRNGREITIDLMRCNDRYCVNMFNTGFDCEVVKRMQVIKRKVPAGMAYALGVVIELIKKPCAVMKVMADGVFALEGKKLLDGGIADSIPLRFFQSIGYEKNVVVLTQPRDFVKTPNDHLPAMRVLLRKYPKLLQTAAVRHHAYNAQTAFVRQEEQAGRAFVIAPEAPLKIGSVEKDPEELRRVYRLGRKAAEKQLEAMKRFLGG